MRDFPTFKLLRINNPVSATKDCDIVQPVLTACFSLMPSKVGSSGTAPATAENYHQSKQDQHGRPKEGAPVIRNMNDSRKEEKRSDRNQNDSCALILFTG